MLDDSPIQQFEQWLEQAVKVGLEDPTVRCRAGLDWFFGGLNFQIEHHLVPDCPAPHLRELRAIVHPLCINAGLPYREEGFRQALVSVTRHVRDIAHRFGR